MSAPVFVDTNVLIYALDDSTVKKQEAARLWRAELWRSRRSRISFQVLQEFYVKVMKKVPSVQQEARSEVRDLLAWRPVVRARPLSKTRGTFKTALSFPSGMR